MSLEQWFQICWLQQFDPTVAEILKLIQVVDRDLQDARAQGLSADGRFQHAYDAALQLCMIALKASGYAVPKGQSHHKRGIDSLRYTLGDRWSETADHIDRCSNSACPGPQRPAKIHGEYVPSQSHRPSYCR